MAIPHEGYLASMSCEVPIVGCAMLSLRSVGRMLKYLFGTVLRLVHTKPDLGNVLVCLRAANQDQLPENGNKSTRELRTNNCPGAVSVRLDISIVITCAPKQLDYAATGYH